MLQAMEDRKFGPEIWFGCLTIRNWKPDYTCLTDENNIKLENTLLIKDV